MDSQVPEPTALNTTSLVSRFGVVVARSDWSDELSKDGQTYLRVWRTTGSLKQLCEFFHYGVSNILNYRDE